MSAAKDLGFQEESLSQKMLLSHEPSRRPVREVGSPPRRRSTTPDASILRRTCSAGIARLLHGGPGGRRPRRRGRARRHGRDGCAFLVASCGGAVTGRAMCLVSRWESMMCRRTAGPKAPVQYTARTSATLRGATTGHQEPDRTHGFWLGLHRTASVLPGEYRSGCFLTLLAPWPKALIS